MSARLVQPAKAYAPMVDMFAGKVMVFSERHCLNASSSIPITVDGMMVFPQPATRVLLAVLMIALHLPLES